MTTESKNSQITFGKLLFTFVYVLIFPIILLILSGNWVWIEGWIFSFWYSCLCFTAIIYLYKKDPALLSERYKKTGAENQKMWDKYVVYFLIIGFTTWIIIMPLDAVRFSLTYNFPTYLKFLGCILLLFSFFFFIRSYIDNTFLSPLVRMQTERKQQVISSGVYGIVRHPMYFGALLLFIGTPLLLGSIYGIIIGLLIMLVLIFRIIGEEQMLTNELDGYNDYKAKVKYRLIPFIW